MNLFHTPWLRHVRGASFAFNGRDGSYRPRSRAYRQSRSLAGARERTSADADTHPVRHGEPLRTAVGE